MGQEGDKKRDLRKEDFRGLGECVLERREK